MDLLLEKLNALTAAWKALPAHGTEPDIPLRWSIDPFGLLRLDNIWIAPARYVDVSRLDECARNVQDTYFEISMEKELLVVIIIQEFDKYEIHAIERHI